MPDERCRALWVLPIVVILLRSLAHAQTLPMPVGITFARGGPLSSNRTSYIHGGAAVDEASQSFVYPVDVVLRNLATVCKLGANPGPLTGGRVVFELTAGSSGTGVQTACDTSTWIAHDTTTASRSITAGEFVTLRGNPTNPPVNTQVFASWQTFDTDGVTPLVFIEGGGAISKPADGQYCDIMKGSCNFGSATLAARVAATAFSVDKFSVTLGNAPGATTEETYCLHDVSTATDLVCTPMLTGAQRAAISPGCSANCTVHAGDEIAIRAEVVGSGRLSTRHFAIHVTGTSTQILFGGTTGGLLAAAGPAGVDFTTSPGLAVFPVATPVTLANLFVSAASNARQTVHLAASGNCDEPVSGGRRPGCMMAGGNTCSDTSNAFDLHGVGCFRVEHAVGGTVNVRMRGGVELRQGPAFCASDCNGDALVTVDEAVYAIDTTLGRQVPSGCRDADVNQDDVVTIEDLVDAAIGTCLP